MKKGVKYERRDYCWRKVLIRGRDYHTTSKNSSKIFINCDIYSNFLFSRPWNLTMITRLGNIISSYIILRDGLWNGTTKHHTFFGDTKKIHCHDKYLICTFFCFFMFEQFFLVHKLVMPGFS